jgi:hypothetical protein
VRKGVQSTITDVCSIRVTSNIRKESKTLQNGLIQTSTAMYDPRDIAREVDMPLFMEYAGQNRELIMVMLNFEAELLQKPITGQTPK